MCKRMPKRIKKNFRKILMARRAVLFAFVLVAVVSVLTPHIFKGHVIGSFSIPEDYEQSVIIFVESVFIFLIYRIYRRKINSLFAEREQIENELKNSYEHIGRINNERKLLKDFMSICQVFPGKEVEKVSYAKLLSYLFVSVAKSKEGLVRFIDIRSGKTLKELYYPSGDSGAMNFKLSNLAVANGNLEHATNREDINVIESYYQESPIKCVLCFKSGRNEYDKSLLRLLLTHIHLLFLASFSRSALR